MTGCGNGLDAEGFLCSSLLYICVAVQTFIVAFSRGHATSHLDIPRKKRWFGVITSGDSGQIGYCLESCCYLPSLLYCMYINVTKCVCTLLMFSQKKTGEFYELSLE